MNDIDGDSHSNHRKDIILVLAFILFLASMLIISPAVSAASYKAKGVVITQKYINGYSKCCCYNKKPYKNYYFGSYINKCPACKRSGTLRFEDRHEGQFYCTRCDWDTCISCGVDRSKKKWKLTPYNQADTFSMNGYNFITTYKTRGSKTTVTISVKKSNKAAAYKNIKVYYKGKSYSRKTNKYGKVSITFSGKTSTVKRYMYIYITALQRVR